MDDSKVITEIKNALRENFVRNGTYFPVLTIHLEGNGVLEAVHHYGDHESYFPWKGELTKEEMIYLRDSKLCQTRIE